MSTIISKSLLLLVFAVVICCVIYPGVLWVIGQTCFPFQANGSIIKSQDGTPVGSLLVAQPFTKDEYFQPRPSACSYNAAASASSALAVSNYALRDRVARMIGPIATYASGEKKGKPVAPDVEAWFQKDQFGGQPGIVAQWADAHNSLAQAWVGTTFDEKNATPQQQYVLDWEKSHADAVAKYKKDNPDKTDPAPADLGVVFFEGFSKENPGKFLTAVTKTEADGKTTTTTVEPVNAGADIQSIFFDMWRQEHPTEDLTEVPGDMVTTSGSGLDPHITLENAKFQLDRVVAKWTEITKRPESEVRKTINDLLQSKAAAPFGGLAGEPMVNVLEVNVALTTAFNQH
jgi:potassium-transporting ATPase KdpC subunit